MDRRQFFDRHSATWHRRQPPDEAARLARVVRLARVRPGQRVLDLGAGAGVLFPHLVAALGPDGQVVACDLSAEMLAAARRHRPDAASLLQADAHALPFSDASFDRVICNAALPHFDDRARCLRETARVLRPDGILVVSHPIGREAVNARHRRAGGPVAEDRVPPPRAMTHLLREAGLIAVSLIDEPEFYLARGRRSRRRP